MVLGRVGGEENEIGVSSSAVNETLCFSNGTTHIFLSISISLV